MAFNVNERLKVCVVYKNNTVILVVEHISMIFLSTPVAYLIAKHILLFDTGGLVNYVLFLNFKV